MLLVSYCKKYLNIRYLLYILINSSFLASSSSDSIVPETEKLYMEGRIVQKLECRPYGKNIISKYLKYFIIEYMYITYIYFFS